MKSRYSHSLADRTAIALVDFSTGVLQLSAIMPDASCNLILAYDDKPNRSTTPTEVFVYVVRNNDGAYFFNGVEVGDLNQAIQIYAMMCVEIIKSVATDEGREDYFEDLNRSSDDDDSDNRLMRAVRDDSSFVHREVITDDDDQEIIEHYAMETSEQAST